VDRFVKISGRDAIRRRVYPLLEEGTDQTLARVSIDREGEKGGTFSQWPRSEIWTEVNSKTQKTKAETSCLNFFGTVG